MSRHRNWVFTLNNHTPEKVFQLSAAVDGGRAKFLCFQGEVGVNGTRHLQGCVIFSNAVTLAGCVGRLCPGVHVECMRGTFDQARDYCCKDDSRDPLGPAFAEFGDRPAAGQGSRTDWEEIRDKLKEGGSLEEIAESYPGHFVRYAGGIQKLASIYKGKRTTAPTVLWYYGATGTGKTRFAFDRYPDAYFKMGRNHWWDGYEQQGAVIIDDYRRDLCPFHELLRLLDRYPYRVEIKGGSLEFNSSVIIITTPKSPRDTWEGRTEEDIAQLLRRITEVRSFSEHPFLPELPDV